MRYAITFEVPVEVGNAFEKDPKAAEYFFKLLEETKLEAAYTSSSRRFMILIVNAESHEELSKLLVPFWHTLKVYPKIDTVMNMEEWKAAFQTVGELKLP